MRQKFPILLIAVIFITHAGIAQSWNIAGNANATFSSKLGTSNLIPLSLFTNNLERLRIDASGKIGIGTSNPLNILTIQLNGSVPATSWLAGGSSLPVFLAFAENKATGFNLATAADAAGFRPVLNTRRSRGTLAAPTAVVSNDYLASFVSSGYDGSTFQNSAGIDFYVDGTPSAGNVPTRISFVTGTNSGNRLERLKVGSTGNFNFNNNQLTILQATGKVGIGTNTPSSELDVIGRGRFTKGLVVDSGGISGTDYNLFGVQGHGSIGVYAVGGNTGAYGIGLLYGVYGDGKKYGLYGSSDQGNGVFGVTNQEGAAGIRGEAKVINGTGVLGTGNYIGVQGSGTENNGVGVRGMVYAANGIGVVGYGGIYGVFGSSNLDNGFGVVGQALSTNATAVSGIGGKIGVKGAGFQIGVYGTTNASGANGVRGESTGANSFGVVGTSTTNVGIYGEGRLGVTGYSTVANGRGIDGEVVGSNAIGVYGYSKLNTGVYGYTAAPSTQFEITYAGFFSGNVGTTGSYFTVSDRKLKQNIVDVSDAMSIINKLQPKSYDFRHDGDYKLMNLPEGKNYGLIAQDVEEVLPNLVKDTKFETSLAMPFQKPGENLPASPPGNTSSPETIPYKTINYTQLIPIIIKGMQEMDQQTQQENKVLRATVESLELRLQKLEALLTDKINNTNTTANIASLEQNVPNPFNKTTAIRYYIPKTVALAKLTLTSETGQLLKTVMIQTKGAGQVSLNSGLLAAGTYNYSLWIEGKLIDTKRLIMMK